MIVVNQPAGASSVQFNHTIAVDATIQHKNGEAVLLTLSDIHDMLAPRRLLIAQNVGYGLAGSGERWPQAGERGQYQHTGYYPASC